MSGRRVERVAWGVEMVLRLDLKEAERTTQVLSEFETKRFLTLFSQQDPICML